MSKKLIVALLVILALLISYKGFKKEDPHPYTFRFPLETKNINEVPGMVKAIKMLKQEEQLLVGRFVKREKDLTEFKEAGIEEPYCSIYEAIIKQKEYERRSKHEKKMEEKRKRARKKAEENIRIKEEARKRVERKIKEIMNE